MLLYKKLIFAGTFIILLVVFVIYETTKYTDLKKDCVERITQMGTQVKIFFEGTPKMEDVKKFVNDISDNDRVERVEIISASQALDEFKQRHKTDKIILEAVESLSGNPLSLYVTLKFKTLNDVVDFHNIKEIRELAGKYNLVVNKNVDLPNLNIITQRQIYNIDYINDSSSFLDLTKFFSKREADVRGMLKFCTLQ